MKYCVYWGIFLTLLQVKVIWGSLNKEEEECVRDLQLNKSVIESWNVEPQIPENNLELEQYMSCYWKKLGYQNLNGEINLTELFRDVHQDLKRRFHNDCTHIANFILAKCKTTIQAETDGLKAIRMWNCLNHYTENLF